MAPTNQFEELDCRIEQGSVTVPEPSPVATPVGSPVYTDYTALDMSVQSEPIPAMSGVDLSADVHETVTFNDTSRGAVAGLDIAPPDVTSIDQTENIDFVKFLSRPVRIASFTWAEADVVGTTRNFNPWELYFSDARVKYKLNNFSFVQCKLKLKVLLNASPFYYGRMYMGYQPLPTLTPSTIQNDSGTKYFIPLSQRPHLWLEPQLNAGGEMTLPFFYQSNWINAQSNQAMIDQGRLSFVNYTTLESANGAVGSGVTISVYAWAEDVKLSGPSVGLATQSMVVQSDEYGQGAVSGPASAVARAASMLEKVPVIGKFATATRMGARAVSSIASLFGWTNVPVITDTHPVRPDAFPQLASTQIGYPVQKLTLDPKNELTVDPTVVGLTSDDELNIVALASRESYLTTATWSTVDASDKILFTSRVTPRLYDTDGATNAKIYMTPLCWVSALFNNWRGDIVFKFSIVASQFHKGRLRVSFDPTGSAGMNIISEVNTSNVVFTSIIDLGVSNEIEFVVPYQQAISYLTNRSTGYTTANMAFSTSATPTYTYDPQFDNGTITVRVLTALTAPVAASEVKIVVAVRAAENIEFANPVEAPDFSMFAVQSDTITTATLGTMQNKHCNEQNLINFGETVKSLRLLLRRSTLVSVSTPATDTTSDVVIWRKNYSKIPGMYGYDPGGINNAKGIVAPGSNFQYNYSHGLPLTWILPAFVAYRGSTVWTFNVASGSTPVEHMRAIRLTAGTQTAGEASTTFALGTPGPNTRNFYFLDPGASGCALVNSRTSAGLIAGAPNYSPYRFQSTAPKYYTRPTSADGSNLDMYRLECMFSGTGAPLPGKSTVWAYHAIGTDFNMHFFLNVPTFWAYTSVPTAN